MDESSPAQYGLSADELTERAYAAYDAGELKTAETLCRQVLARQARSEAAAFLAGVIAGRSGDYCKSEQLLRDTIRFDPGSVRARVHLASVFRQQGRLHDAEVELREARRLNPNDAVINNELGVCWLADHRWAEAASCFERAIDLQSNFAFAHYNLGIAREAQSRVGDAIVSFRRAATAAPDLAEAHAKLGDLLYELGSHAEGIAAFRRAASAKPNSATADLNLAKVHIHEQEPTKAEVRLRRILAQNPKNCSAWRLLAMALRQLGRFDEAAESLGKSLDLAPRQTVAYHDLVHTKRLTPADLPQIERMRNLLTLSSLTDRERTSLHFALGKALDDLGDYGQAIAHFDEANRLENSRYSFDAAAHRAGIDRTITLYTDEFLRSQVVTANPSERPLLIVGMMRSGTTLVEQILSSHPEIGAGGELTFWGDAVTELEFLAPEKLGHSARQKLSREYLALLHRIAPTATRVADKMPHNFLWLGLIHSLFPAARIIHCRRDPIDTCLSIYFTHFGVAKDFAYDRKNIVAFYQEYDRLMAHWRRVLPRDRFIEVDYEDVVANREAAARKLIAFCCVPWSDACLRHHENKRAVKTASMWQARQPIYTTSVERWQRYKPWLAEFDRLHTKEG